MKRIRIGNDFDVLLSVSGLEGRDIFLDKENVAVALIGPDRGRELLPVDSVKANVIQAHVGHEAQRMVGLYRIEVWVNTGGRAQIIGDKPSAFQIVALSTQADDVKDAVSLGNVEMELFEPRWPADEVYSKFDGQAARLSDLEGWRGGVRALTAEEVAAACK